MKKLRHSLTELRKKTVLLFVFALMSAGCTGYDSSAVTEDNVSYYLSKSGKKAFAGLVQWNGDLNDTSIEIRDTVNSAKVVSLGGFFGTGVPVPFAVEPVLDAWSFLTYSYVPADYGAAVFFEELPFTVRIGPSLQELRYQTENPLIGTRNEDGNIVLRKPVYVFEADENNPVFASDHGVLIRRETGEAAEEFLEMGEGSLKLPDPQQLPLRIRLTGTYRFDETDEEYSAAEVFSEDGRIFVNVGTYMHEEADDSMYVYHAMELIPDDPSLLDAPGSECTVGIREYSSFSNMGLYWEKTLKNAVLKITEDGFVLKMQEGEQVFLRQDSAPKQFPVQPSMLESLKQNGEKIMLPGRLSSYPAFLAADERRSVHLYQDGTLSVIVKSEEEDRPDQVYRGVAAYVGNSLLFELTELGYAMMPAHGRITVERQDDGTVIFTKETSEGCSPLMDEEMESQQLKLLD